MTLDGLVQFCAVIRPDTASTLANKVAQGRGRPNNNRNRQDNNNNNGGQGGKRRRGQRNQ